MLDADTGGGKSLIAEATRRALGVKACYVVATKTLQEQVASTERGFGDYARVVMGRDNYPTELRPRDFDAPWGRRITCGDCTGDDCTYCVGRGSCPYYVAKAAAVGAPLTPLNAAYFLGEANSPRSQFAGRGLVVYDEADELENQIMGHVEVRISDRRARQLGIRKPKVTVPDGWWDWVQAEALPSVRSRMEALRGRRDPLSIRERTSLERLAANLLLLEPDEDEEGLRWVYTGAGARDRDDWSIAFKPVTVDAVAPAYALGGQGQHYLLMSASFVSTDVVAEGLGLDPDHVGVVRMEEGFDPSRRPVRIDAVATVTHDNKPDAYPALAKKLEVVLERHPDERGLVHTVSYELAGYLTRALAHTGRVRQYHNASERAELLRWMRETEGAVVCAPSFERGIDLPHELCRFIVVAKVPYPYLGDPQTNARMRTTKNGRLWYAVQTVRRLVQQTGRGMRAADDHCTCYVLDKEFSRLWGRRRRLFPKRWRKSVVWIRSP